MAEGPVTIQCVWRPVSENPEGYGPARDRWHRGDESALGTEMRLWGSAERYAFCRLQEGVVRNDLKPHLQEVFGLNSRYCDDAIVHAQAIIDSQRELIPMELEETKAKLDKSNQKQKADRAKAAKLRQSGSVLEAARTESAIAGREQRVAKLERKLAEYRDHQANGTIPTVVFGGRKLWRKVCRGRATREEWRASRRGRLYARGDATKAGNPHTRVSLTNGALTMSVALSHLVVTKQAPGMPGPTSAPRVEGELWVPDKYRSLLGAWVASGDAYSVELRRDGELLRAHVTGPSGVQPVAADRSRGVLAFDTNPDGLAFYNLDSRGNRERFPKGFCLPQPTNLAKYPGECHIGVGNGVLWIKVPDWTQGSTDRRDYLAGVVAKLVCDAAAQLGKPLALEGLGFAKDHDPNRSCNRMSAGFAYQKVLEAVVRRAVKVGVAWCPANPAYTSAMGRWRYQAKEGLSGHQAAAKVIGRRALGYPERFDPTTRKRISRLREGLLEAAAAADAKSTPTEGARSKSSGIAKRLTGTLAAERLIAVNGYPPWRRRWRKGSPWGALVECQRYRWSRAVAAGATTIPVGDLTDRRRTDEVAR
jgi:predicted transposase